MLLLAGKAANETDAGQRLSQLLDSGRALDKFREWIGAQDGDLACVDDLRRLPAARFIEPVPASRSGYIAALDAREVGLAAMLLGGGRARKEDQIDHAVGVVLHAKIGDRVEQGQPLLTIHANEEAKLAEARQRLVAAYEWSHERVSLPPLIHRIIG